MNEEEESHWLSGTPEEPMRMKGMGGEPPLPPQKKTGGTIIAFAMLK